MMTNQSMEDAVKSYQAVRDRTLGPVEIVVALYQGILSNLEGAKSAYRARELEKMVALNGKIFTILMALQSHLDYERGGQAAVALNQFYNAVFSNVARILDKRDPYAEYTVIEGHVRDVCQQWVTLASKVAAQERQRMSTPSEAVTTSA